ncbi:MAG: DNA-protecting protein DprA [Ruminococcaceae bacterium]|nr:DNA-protecting protein DprA [Oscillospiraceae bacterium]
MDSRLYWIWLQQVLPYGSKAVGDLLDAFGHARTVYEATPETLKKSGIKDDLCRRLSDKSLDTAHRILDRVLEMGDWVLTPEDALYPLALRHMTGCPAALYARGTMPDLDTTPAVAVVGTRHASHNGCQEAYALSAGLAAGGMVVVSGGAVGIDAAAHSGALAAGGITIVCMACPLNENYPVENTDLRRQVVERGGLLLSEFPPDEPYQCDFHVRNRLMVGLSQAVCLAETPKRSGARISARLAREQNRELFALPGALSGRLHDGAHIEIQKGATLVIRATDILRDYAPLYPGVLDLEQAETVQQEIEGRKTAPPKKPEKRSKLRRRKESKKEKKQIALPDPPAEETAPVPCPDTASPAARQVYAALTDRFMPVDELAVAAGMPIPALLAALTELEMYGCAQNGAGQQYKRGG